MHLRRVRRSGLGIRLASKLQAGLRSGLFLTLALEMAARAQTPGHPLLPTNPPSTAAHTATPTPTTTAAKSGGPVAPQGQSAPMRPARVHFAGGQLTVAADNSSLNQVLREIAKAAGLKITGGTLEERVFGVYGPGDVSGVLLQLLAGSGSNIMILEDGHRQPVELVLTPRGGGPTPPNPNAVHDAEADLPPAPSGRGPFRGFGGSTLPPQQATGQLPVGEPGAGAPPPRADTTTQQSPNGVKTPQQVYDELLRLQGEGNATPGTGALQAPPPH